MSVIIPAGDGVSPYFDLQVVLEGVTYTLEFRWNVRLGAWFMNIYDADGTTAILVGIRLVANYMLGAYNVGYGGPPGGFAAFDTSGQGLDPGLEELGDRVQLIYYTAAELGI